MIVVNNYILEKLKKPFVSDEFQFVTNFHSRMNVARDAEIWIDKYGCKHQYNGEKYIIGLHNSTPFFDGEAFVRHLNTIPNIPIIIEVSGENLAYLTKCLKDGSINKNVYIKIRGIDSKLPKCYDLDFSNLSTKVTIGLEFDIVGYPSKNGLILEYWFLWLKDTDFQNYLKFLDEKTRQRIIEVRNIAFNFYEKYKSVLEKKSNLEKADFVYNYCKREIPYDFNSTNRGGYDYVQKTFAHDAVGTYRNKKGVCEGRANLMRILLNNIFLQVATYCVTCRKNGDRHALNVVIDDNKKYYYDLSYKLSRSNESLSKNNYTNCVNENGKQEVFLEEMPSTKDSIHFLFAKYSSRFNVINRTDGPTAKESRFNVTSRTDITPEKPRFSNVHITLAHSLGKKDNLEKGKRK